MDLSRTLGGVRVTQDGMRRIRSARAWMLVFQLRHSALSRFVCSGTHILTHASRSVSLRRASANASAVERHLNHCSSC